MLFPTFMALAVTTFSIGSPLAASGADTVMKEVGLAPVFYGRVVAGSHMPCLMYMTCGENPDVHKKHWQAFSASPVWKGLQNDPQYKDNMIGMIRVLLKRMPASQI